MARRETGVVRLRAQHGQIEVGLGAPNAPDSLRTRYEGNREGTGRSEE